jgi:hypothetical protein
MVCISRHRRLCRVEQQADGRGGVQDAGMGLGGGEGVEEAVVIGPAVERPAVNMCLATSSLAPFTGLRPRDSGGLDQAF